MKFDALYTIAEVAGVFVGFAALATVVIGGRDSARRDVGKYLLINVIVVGAVLLLGALTPAACSTFDIEMQYVWRISSGILFALNLLAILVLQTITRGIEFAHQQRRITSVAGWSLEPLFQILLLINIIGWKPHLAEGFYTTALLITLFQGLIVITDLVVTSLGETD